MLSRSHSSISLCLYVSIFCVFVCLYVNVVVLSSIDKSCNPQWTTVLTLDYEHGKDLYFYVKVMRLAKNRIDSKPVGAAIFEVGDVLGSNRAKARRFKTGGW